METKKYITIDGMQIPIEGEKNVLELIRKANIDLPTFCYHSELSTYGACRLCVCEIEGAGVQATCSIIPTDGMVVRTNTAEIRKIRKVNFELLLANHQISCPTCSRSNNCRLQDLGNRLGISDSRFKKTDEFVEVDNKSKSIVHDPNKCVLCGDCVRVCKEVQTVGAIDFAQRGAATRVSAAFGKSLADVECVNCGQCVSVCPVGALTPKSEHEEVWNDLDNKEKITVVQVAPAVRVAIGEEFGLEAGVVSTGKLVAALKRIGFDHVYDTSFAADLTVFEEATEFINRYQNKENLPQFTSCCPSWVKFSEQYYPELIPNLSSCKSPQQMFGSLAKSYLPEILGVKKENISVVSIMPCTAKKFEAKREELAEENIPEVDHVITTTELARMIQESGLQFNKLSPESFDLPLGFKTGAGVIFGNSGGVSEAVLRFAYEKISGKTLLDADFHETRGKDGIREVNIEIGDTKLNLAIVHSLKNARKICNEIKEGNSKYDLVEVMACPGGCIDGGGQPVSFDEDFKEKRTQGIYNCDKQLQLHKSQDNPYIQEIYEKHLGEIGGHNAHDLLHTKYSSKKRIVNQSIKIRDLAQNKIEVCICVGTNCFIRGSQDLLKQLMAYVTENKLEDIVGFEGHEEIVDVKATFCFEKCERGPVVRINSKVIEHATFDIARKALDDEIQKIKELIIQ